MPALDGEPFDQRQREVRRRLDQLGLRAGPRRLDADAAGAAGPAYKLRLVLEQLGSVFSAFGVYLASRADLLPPDALWELGVMPVRGEPISRATIDRQLRQHLGGVADTLLRGLADEASSEPLLLSQLEVLTLPSGQVASVEVLHPALAQRVANDLKLLPLLIEQPWEPRLQRALELAAADFPAALAARTDLARTADNLRALADLRIRAARVLTGLSSADLLITEQLPGVRLDGVLGDDRGPEATRVAERALRSIGVTGTEVARKLAQLWLRLAFEGAPFPVDLRPRDLVIGDDGELALVGGAMSRLPDSSRANLLDYLFAVEQQDPDRAAELLLQELTGDAAEADDEELRRGFRKAVPFRDGPWGEVGSGRLAEHLCIQWRLASEAGHRPRPYLISFYRGLFRLAHMVNILAPGEDVLREAVWNAMLRTRWNEASRMLSTSHLGDRFASYGALLLSLPQKLDALLSLTRDGALRVKIKPEEGRDQGRSNARTGFVALLLVFAAVALLAQRFATLPGLGPWVEWVGAAAVLVVGLCLLGYLVKSG